MSRELMAVTVIPAITPDELSFSPDTLLTVKVRSRKEPPQTPSLLSSPTSSLPPLLLQSSISL